MAGLASIRDVCISQKLPEEAKQPKQSDLHCWNSRHPGSLGVQSLLVITLLGWKVEYVMVPGITLLPEAMSSA